MKTVTAVPTKTVGTSPKAILAALLPAVGTVLAVAVQWIVTGEYDRAELVTSLSGLIAAAVGGLGAWLGSPGTVEVTTSEAHPVGPASDDLLPADAVEKLTTEPPDPVRPSSEAGSVQVGVLLVLLGIAVAVLVHWGLGVLLIVVGLIVAVLSSRPAAV